MWEKRELVYRTFFGLCKFPLEVWVISLLPVLFFPASPTCISKVRKKATAKSRASFFWPPRGRRCLLLHRGQGMVHVLVVVLAGSPT